MLLRSAGVGGGCCFDICSFILSLDTFYLYNGESGFSFALAVSPCVTHAGLTLDARHTFSNG